jgi:glycerol-3-phosphate cytidylyltransferase
MENKLNQIRSKKQNFIVGFTSVVGDLVHAGHVLMLDECKMHCDYLYVGLISDPTIDRPEKNKPIQSLFERYVQLSTNRNIDEIIPLTGEDDLELAIRSLPIDVRFVGEDYLNKDFTGKDACNELGIRIIYNQRKHKLSSTELRKRMRKHDK